MHIADNKIVISFKNISVVLIITARKRSLGQGNMFTPVCLSVHGGRVWSRRGCLVRGSGSGGVAWSGGLCGSGGMPDGDSLPGRLLLRTVRILLECILVHYLPI